jgi:retron-type reverse transcriptase
LLGDTVWPEKKQLACLYALSNNAEKHYKQIKIKKSDGSMRHILTPDPLLKYVQRNILRRVLYGMPVSDHATAYREGISIVDNAAVHTGQKQILKMDITRFFDHIFFPAIYGGVFHANIFPPGTAALLTYLCTYCSYLPQGAPTSAAISNLIMRPFDTDMADWCARRHVRYTRYCDDMTFSGDFDAVAVEHKVRELLGSMGFSVNKGKTKLLSSDTRQIVTGIVVNVKPQVSRAYRRRLRQEVFYCEKYGVFSHLDWRRDHIRATDYASAIRYLNSLLGKINYVLQVNARDAAFIKAKTAISRIRDALESRMREEEAGSAAIDIN